MPASRKLNLGCGNYPLADHVNVDGDFRVRPQVICDLDHRPYPFPDGAFTTIFASHVLEHLHDPFAAMDEWHRLLAPGGELHIKVPHFSRGFTHPGHKRGFDISFPHYFDENMPPWYVGTSFRLKSLRLHWNAQPYLKRYVASPFSCGVAAVLGFIIDTVANLNPMVFSRLLSFWVGGFEELDVVFERPSRST